MKFDHAILIVAVTVVFTRLIVSEDNLVIEILKSIGHNQLVESLAVADMDVGMEFMRDGQRWMVEDISNDMVTASNCFDEIICLNKTLITCL